MGDAIGRIRLQSSTSQSDMRSHLWEISRLCRGVKAQVGQDHTDRVPGDRWIDGRDIDMCMCCQTISFNVWTWKHHCRYCGRVVCDSCSQVSCMVLLNPNPPRITARLIHESGRCPCRLIDDGCFSCGCARAWSRHGHSIRFSSDPCGRALTAPLVKSGYHVASDRRPLPWLTWTTRSQRRVRRTLLKSGSVRDTRG
jgi:hypothetical protein